jgi:DNA recombination protein RmuC
MPEWLTPLVVGLLIGAGLAGLLVWLFRQQLKEAREDFEKLREDRDQEKEARIKAEASSTAIEKNLAEQKALLEEAKTELSNTFKALAAEALKGNNEGFLMLADQKIQPLNQHLDKVRDLVNKLEKDREQKFGALRSEIERTGEVASKLQKSTDRLNEVLSNPTARGNWGEKMAEDVLQLAGLQEGINYVRQTSQDGKRPDYTFLLPNNLKVNMDIKFPYKNYKDFIASSSESERGQLKGMFLRNVKTMIDDVTKNRNYIDPASGTLDYVLVFIPSEAVYRFLHEEGGELIEKAQGQKAILCSPWMLYALLMLIRQATEIFRMEGGAREILNHIQEFQKQWQKYAQEFEKLGENLETTRRKYEEVAGRRSRGLDRVMSRIEALRGQSQSADASEESADSQEKPPD